MLKCSRSTKRLHFTAGCNDKLVVRQLKSLDFSPVFFSYVGKSWLTIKHSILEIDIFDGSFIKRKARQFVTAPNRFFSQTKIN